MGLCFKWKGLYDYTNASNEIVHMGKLSSANKEISKCWVVPIRMIVNSFSGYHINYPTLPPLSTFQCLVQAS